MRKKLVITIAVMVSMLLMGIVVVGAVTSQSESEDNIIYAAYNRATGALRIVTNGRYRPNEERIEWSKEGGPQGPRGETGPQGPQGPQGEQGAIDEALLQTLLTKISYLENRVAALDALLLEPDCSWIGSWTITIGEKEYDLTLKLVDPYIQGNIMLDSGGYILIGEEQNGNTLAGSMNALFHGGPSGTFVFTMLEDCKEFEGTITMNESTVDVTGTWLY